MKQQTNVKQIAHQRIQILFEQAKKIAKTENVPVIVHSRDGHVVSVSINSPRIAGRKVFSANVKRTLNSKNVRNTIAEVIYATAQKK